MDSDCQTWPDSAFWPTDTPLPDCQHVKVVRRPQPCPHCRRVRLDNGKPAVCVAHSGEDGSITWLRCRACERSFPVATRIVVV